jgi:hypothetical protein
MHDRDPGVRSLRPDGLGFAERMLVVRARVVPAAVRRVTEGESMSTYRVLVYTGNLSPGAFAGTDANVYMTLYGAKASSDEVMFDNAGNRFEQGAVDTFALHLAELGDIQKIKIRHDNKFLAPGWYLERVEIRNEDSDREWTFPCQRWLARDEDDGEIERTLDAA